MSRLILAATALAMGALAVSAPAMAKDAPPPPPQGNAPQGNERVNMVIIYGNDKCPESKGGEITVCARKDESERYRIPAPFRESASPQNEAWTNRVIAYESVGATGTTSCSPVGAGGWTGCEGKFIKNAYAEKKQSSDVQFSRMIEEAREKRMANVDAEAAETQARVDAAEKQYEARERAKEEKAEADREAAAKGTAANPADQTGK